MFILLKVVKPFVLPAVWIAIGMVAAFVAVSRGRTALGRRVLLATFIVFSLLATEPVAYFLAWSLERTATTPPVLDGAAIVILAGGGAEAGGHRPFAELSEASWRRLSRGIAVYRELEGKIPIIYSGGSGDPFAPVSTEGMLAQTFAGAMGIPGDQFWLESSSRTTRESARAIRDVLRHRLPFTGAPAVILVTSAWHLPRASAAFRRVGIVVTPVPADFATGTFTFDPLSILPTAEHFAASALSIHEWMGILMYRLLGDA